MKQFVISLLLTGAFGAAASGQTVFFDDFEGNALLPHWTHSPPGEWVYSVSNSQLHVEELPWPSQPKNPSNQAGMFTRITPLEGDFRVHVRMGWEANSIPLMLFSISDSSTHLIAAFGISSGEIYARTGLTQPMFFPAPPPGMHNFVVDRVGPEVRFTLNEQLLLTLPDAAPGGLLSFHLLFSVPYPNAGFDPVHIDLVHIVPAPSVMIALMITSGMAITKRR